MNREGSQGCRGAWSEGRAHGGGTRQKQEFTGKGRASEWHFIEGFSGLFFVYLFSVRLCSLCRQEEGVDSVSDTLNLYIVKWRCSSRQLARTLEAEWESKQKINFEIFCL